MRRWADRIWPARADATTIEKVKRGRRKINSTSRYGIEVRD
jgi:hypothetical protein